MFRFILLACSFLILPRAFSEEQSRLLLVQTLFRHGDRSPVLIYPTDPNKEDKWPGGLGKLTLLGKKQHYALGKYLRRRYEDFITTNPSEIQVNSSAANRCLTGAAATVASFYVPKGRWKFEDGLCWQPIPIYYLPLYEDKFLSYRRPCPRLAAQTAEDLNSKMQELHQKNGEKFEAITNLSGLNVSEGINAMYLHDALLIEKRKNLPVPEWVHLYWNVLKEASDAIFDIFTNSSLVFRLRAGPLLQEISQNMMKKINGEIPDFKVQMYSAHDANIAVILMALNFTYVPHPPYCATLLFELHEMPDSTIAVRLLYLNSTDPLNNIGEPHVLVLENCSEFCPLENFTKKIEPLIPDDWEQECGSPTSNPCEFDKQEAFLVVPNSN